MTKRNSTARFVRKAIIVHGGKYSYGNAEYKTAHCKIIICCKKHGDFEQRASSHLEGHGCKHCADDSRRFDVADFVERAKKKHDDLYSYEKVKYRSSVKPVIITCKKHGDFKRTPHHHLLGAGCLECVRLSSGRNRTSLEFTEKAKVIHGDKYRYEHAVYKNATTIIDIICTIHGVFKQTPHKHLLGHGCPLCGKESASKKRKSSTSVFIRRASKKHNHKYSYEKTSYTLSSNKVLIKCIEHGYFEQEANSHLMGKGCPACAILAFGYTRTDFNNICIKNNDGNGFLYVIRCFDESESFYKIGITSLGVDVRFKGNDLPYNYSRLYLIEAKGSLVFDFEKRLHSLLKRYRYKPRLSFGGETECFTTIKPIEKLLKELSSAEQLQLIA